METELETNIGKVSNALAATAAGDNSEIIKNIKIVNKINFVYSHGSQHPFRKIVVTLHPDYKPTPYSTLSLANRFLRANAAFVGANVGNVGAKVANGRANELGAAKPSINSQKRESNDTLQQPDPESTACRCSNASQTRN